MRVTDTDLIVLGLIIIGTVAGIVSCQERDRRLGKECEANGGLYDSNSNFCFERGAVKNDNVD